MTMLSFRVDERDAGELRAWADRLGLEQSALLREALRRHLARLGSEVDVGRWEVAPLSDGERALEDAADWGPAEDWSDWAIAARHAAEDVVPASGRTALGGALGAGVPRSERRARVLNRL